MLLRQEFVIMAEDSQFPQNYATHNNVLMCSLALAGAAQRDGTDIKS